VFLTVMVAVRLPSGATLFALRLSPDTSNVV
jgi:hypothetical protein